MKINLLLYVDRLLSSRINALGELDQTREAAQVLKVTFSPDIVFHLTDIPLQPVTFAHIGDICADMTQ